MIVVYGATGFTGRLVAHHLAESVEPFVVSGRGEAKLQALVDDVRRVNRDATVEARVAAVSDPDALRSAFEGAGALLNCAGPFELVGDQVVDAAVAAGVPYCDITGEASFMSRVMTRWDDAPVPVVPACGFDFVPHSLAAALASSSIPTPDSIHTALLVRNFGTSAGTRLSAIRQLGEEGMSVVGGRLTPTPMGSVRRSFRFPAPTGDVEAVSYPGGDVLQVHRQFPEAREVRSFFVVPRVATRLTPVLGTVMGGVSRLPSIRRLLERVAASGAEGPSPETRRKTAFAVLAEANGDAGTATAVTTGFDIYGSTVVFATEVARRLANWHEAGVAPGFRAPAEVVGDVREFAQACGLELRLLPR